jgi:ubiquinone/menaquinone biosynthesis C-methylase UbiE
VIRRTIGDRRGLKVLDLGCGPDATLLRALSSRLARGVGVDVEVPHEAEQGGKLTFIASMIEDAIPMIPDQSFDLVLLISVIGRLENPLSLLREARRVARQGATLLISEPTWAGKGLREFSAFRLGQGRQGAVDDQKMYYGKRELWPLLVRTGFRPRDLHLFYYQLGLGLVARAKV